MNACEGAILWNSVTQWLLSISYCFYIKAFLICLFQKSRMKNKMTVLPTSCFCFVFFLVGGDCTHLCIAGSTELH